MNLKHSAVSGAIWRYFEQFSTEIISLVVSIVLARIISVEAYGLIATVNIFITIANVFVTGGLGNALIQDPDADIRDFSTVLWANLGISLGIYLLLFFAAPWIGVFFEESQLVSILRVLGIGIPISAVGSIQQAYVSKKMIFKKFFWASFGGTAASGAVGLWMAYAGFGVWALVGQHLSNLLIDTIILAGVLRIRYVFTFSTDRFKKLVNFGGKLLIVNIADVISANIRSLLIGKYYSQSDLALFNKAQQFPTLIMNNINSTITAVMFPMMAASQKDTQQMKNMMRRVIQTSTFFVFPLLGGLLMVAEPFITVLLTEKWVPCVPYMKIACLTNMMMPLQTANLEIPKAMGRGDFVVKVNLYKKILFAVSLAVIPFGVWWIAVSLFVVSVFSLVINAWPNGELIQYSLLQQLWDIRENIGATLVMCAAVHVTGMLPVGPHLILLLQICAGTVVYAILALTMRPPAVEFIFRTAGEWLAARRGNREEK